DARAAYTGHQHGVGFVAKCRLFRLGQARQHMRDAALAGGPLGLAYLCAVDGHEARAEAVEAREIFVAGGLVDLALGAKLGLERGHGHAVRFHAAVAASLAHGRVDEHALVGIWKSPALAAAALLGCTSLVV